MTSVRYNIPVRLFLTIGHILFVGLFVLAYLHFQERVIHVDSAYQVFKWVQLPGVDVEAYRFTAIFPQLAVKAGRFFGMDLHSLLLLASLAHVAVAYLVFLITAYWLRTPWVAVAAALAAVLCTRLTFYGMVLEANYLLSYPFLLAAVIESRVHNNVERIPMVIAISVLLLVLMVHPVGFLIALFVLVHALLRSPEKMKSVAPLIGIAMAWGLFGRILLPPSGYEAELYSSAVQGTSELGAIYDSASLDFVTGHTWAYTTFYIPVWVLGMVLIAFQIRRRAWPEVVLFVSAFLGFLIINVITFRQGESAMMMEKNFVPLATLLALPFCLELGALTVQNQRWLAIPFLLVLFIQFRGISFASKEANERLAHIGSIVGRMWEEGVQKGAFLSEELDSEGYHIHWALPYETLLYSSLGVADKSVTAIAIPGGIEATKSDTIRFEFGEGLREEQLDPRYFSVAEGPFVLITGIRK